MSLRVQPCFIFERTRVGTGVDRLVNERRASLEPHDDGRCLALGVVDAAASFVSSASCLELIRGGCASVSRRVDADFKRVSLVSIALAVAGILVTGVEIAWAISACGTTRHRWLLTLALLLVVPGVLAVATGRRVMWRSFDEDLFDTLGLVLVLAGMVLIGAFVISADPYFGCGSD
jgi:hypothetical protein